MFYNPRHIISFCALGNANPEAQMIAAIREASR
jgi:hypothetical protein